MMYRPDNKSRTWLAVMLLAGAACTNADDGLTTSETSQSIVANSTVANSTSNSANTIASGGYHECLVARDGSVLCGGLNTAGQLGDGTQINRWTPVPVVGLTHPQTSVTAGANHSCSIDDTGNAHCWGVNTYGQLGNGSNGSTPATTPQPVTWLGYSFSPTGAGFVQLAAGVNHTCGLDVMGFVWCWGQGSSGQLGNNSPALSNTMVNVHNIGVQPNLDWNDPPALAIAVGGYHACALLYDHTVTCWGMNVNGQIGNGAANSTPVTTPVVVSGLTDVSAISASLYGTCALKTNGTLVCWGKGSEGELGNGSLTTAQTTPTPVLTHNPTTGVNSPLTDVYAISAGSTNTHNCVMTGTAGALCWGGNGDGQTGGGSTGAPLRYAMQNYPNPGPSTVAQTSGSPPVEIATGGFHTCARTADGHDWCWGDNTYGVLGNNSNTSSNVPVLNRALTYLAPRQRVVAGLADACALTSAGFVKCWGANAFGEVGTGQTGFVLAPNLPVTGLQNVIALAGGGDYFCALSDGNQGQVSCWGANGSYQLGNGSLTDQPAPVSVLTGPGAPLTDAIAIVPGCAVRADSTVWCWGENSFGQVGNNSTSPAQYATPVLGLTDVVSISGIETSGYCAIKVDGTVWCWGLNNHGQLGNGYMTNKSVPVQVIGFPMYSLPVTVSASGLHSCATLISGSEGGVFCWGDNGAGQLGNGSTTDSSVAVPVGSTIQFPLGQVALSAVSNSTCAVAYGDVDCWGQNNAGQLGDGSLTNQVGPVQITNSNIVNIVEIAQGNDSTYAVRGDGTLWAWGDNAAGQLGIGSQVSTKIPTLVLSASGL